MIIECPHCLTRFRLDPSQLSDSRSMLKCARCKRVFPAPGQSSPTRSRSKRPPREDNNLSFSFDDDDEWRAPELVTDEIAEEEFSLNAPTEVLPPVARSARATPAEPPLMRDDDDEDTDDEEEVERGVERSGISLRSVFVFLLLVVGGYGALTWSLLDDPDWARRLTQTLPVIGKELRERGSVAQDVSLIEVQGRYERTKEGKLVFVITGKAVNNSAESLRSVQILAKLYDGTDHALDAQTSACGSPMEARIRDLSVHQVAILRSIKPPPQFGVQPGGQCPFVSIFLDVPATVGTFSTEVARAHRHA
ncbi:MAG: DUF3426 domain-containing protein [Candidatus Binatia bacterium]